MIDVNDYRDKLKGNNYTRDESASILFLRRVEKWTNGKTGDTVYMILPTTGNIILSRKIGLGDLAPDVVVTSTNSTWTADDVKVAAWQRMIILTDKQSQQLLEDNAKGIGDYGWDGIENVLDDVSVCDECKSAVDVLPDSGVEEDGSYETNDGHICPKCKRDGDYQSCIECEIYAKRGEMNELGDGEYECRDCADYVSCKKCKIYLPKTDAVEVVHNDSEADYFHKDCIV